MSRRSLRWVAAGGVLLALLGLGWWGIVSRASRHRQAMATPETADRVLNQNGGDTSTMGVTLAASAAKVEFGEPVQLVVRIGTPRQGSLVIAPFFRESHRMHLSAVWNGKGRAVLGLHRERVPQTVTMDQQGLVLVYDEITCIPGENILHWEYDGPNGLPIRSNDVHVTVVAPSSPQLAQAAYVRVFRHYAKSDYYMENAGIVPGLRSFSFSMPQTAAGGLQEILSAPEDPESTPLQRTQAVQILGGLADNRLATESHFPRTLLPSATMTRLLANEHNPEVIYNYLMILPFYADHLAADNAREMGQLIAAKRLSRDETIVDAAYTCLMVPRLRGLTDLKKEDLLTEIESSTVLADMKEGTKKTAALPDSHWRELTGEP